MPPVSVTSQARKGALAVELLVLLPVVPVVELVLELLLLVLGLDDPQAESATAASAIAPRLAAARRIILCVLMIIELPPCGSIRWTARKQNVAVP
jgi:hypothetical protein